MFGVQTNIDFTARVVNCPDFANAEFDSGMLQKYPEILVGPTADPDRVAESAVAATCAMRHLLSETAPVPANLQASYSSLIGFQTNMPRSFSLSLQTSTGSESSDSSIAITIKEGQGEPGTLNCTVNSGDASDAQQSEVIVEEMETLKGLWSDVVSVRLGGERREKFYVQFQDGEVLVHREQFDGHNGDLKMRFHMPQRDFQGSGAGGVSNESAIMSPMPGRVSQVFVTEGDSVAEGNVLLEIEAMKMTQALKAPFSAVVLKVNTSKAETVDDSTVLVELERESESKQ